MERGHAGAPDAPDAIRGAAQELPGAGAARPRRRAGVGAMSVAKRKKPNPPVSEPSAKPYEPTDQDRAAAKAHLARRAARTRGTGSIRTENAFRVRMVA